MSKLQELIQQYCPDGVEYKELGTFAKCEKERNKGQKCNLAYSITKGGLVPTVEYFKDAKITSDDTSGYKLVRKNWFVYSPSRIDVGSINYLHDDIEVIVSPLNVVFSVDENMINPSYLLYFLNSKSGTWQIITSREGIEGTGRKLLPFEKFAKIVVPVPPLEIQYKVVQQLDVLYEYIKLLEEELTARQKQYEYYRDSLLNFNHKIWGGQWVELGEVANKISSGKNKEKNSEGNYPVYGSTGIIAYCKDYIYDKSQILIARVGANAGYVHIANGKYDVSDNTIVVNLTDNISLKYIYHLLTNMNLNKYSKGGGQPLITSGQIKQIKIPIPPLDVQQRIVDVLDNFEKICTDLKIGLPAEINARKQQYEYYRDLLLNFDCSQFVKVERERERRTPLTT